MRLQMLGSRRVRDRRSRHRACGRSSCWSESGVERLDRVQAHKRLEAASEQALVAWIGEPESRYQRVRPLVRQTVELVAPLARAALEPVAARLVDEETMVLLLARALDVSGLDSDGREWRNPVQEWVLSEEERRALGDAVLVFLRVLAAAAEVLVRAGVPLQAQSRADMLALGQLLVLRRDLDRSPAELVAGLAVLAQGGFDREGLQLHLTDHLSVDDERVLAQLRRSHRRSQGRPHLRGAYAGGRGRGLPADLTTVTYVYDSAGDPIAETKNAGTTCHSYNAEGRLTSEQAPGDTQATAYTYDPAGQLRTANNAAGTVTNAY